MKEDRTGGGRKGKEDRNSEDEGLREKHREDDEHRGITRTKVTNFLSKTSGVFFDLHMFLKREERTWE